MPAGVRKYCADAVSGEIAESKTMRQRNNEDSALKYRLLLIDNLVTCFLTHHFVLSAQRENATMNFK
jgi:hypothetical protein